MKKLSGPTKIFFSIYIQIFQATEGKNFQMKLGETIFVVPDIFFGLAYKIIDVWN